MIKQLQTDSPRLLAFRLSGKLHDEDYQHFVPTVEAALAEAGGKVSLLAQFEDFHGWDMHAAWDDLRFGMKHYADFDRIAMVGESTWQEWMTRFCKPFTQATVKYFDASEVDAAWDWLRGSNESRS
ncbi:SpoIIAA family protein [Tautonia rosea]|uniref:STAS/SEC14 domain-containing protein n=1 Tax=Tautonia rosea TaxID=2728037 RepID=UPI001472A36F|nr:STAS/SEC14 domain-containing protein [Tautonia rosea]